jgi:hypothetical protein
MMWIPALQRKEARPVGVLLVLWALFLFPIGSCGGMGAYKFARSRAAVVTVSNPAELESLPLGSYVDTRLQLARMARDSFPSDGDYSYVARGYTAYSAGEVPTLVVVAEEPKPRGNGPAQLVGQVCDADAQIVCSLSDEGLGAYIRSLQRTRKSPVRVLIASATPRDNLVEAYIGLGIASLVMLAAWLTTLLLILKARPAGTVAFERTISLRASPDQVRASVRTQTSSSCRIAHDGPERLVLLVGKPVSAARLTGATHTRDIPLRIDIEFGTHAAYRSAAATVRVIQLLGKTIVPPTRRAYAQPTAAEAAGMWILGMCEPS